MNEFELKTGMMIGDKFEHFSRYLLKRNKTTETVKDWQTDRWT